MRNGSDIDWHKALRGEPDLGDVLAEPIIQILMDRDGVNAAEMMRHADGFRRRRQNDTVIDTAA